MAVGMFLLSRPRGRHVDRGRRRLHGRARARPRIRDAGAGPGRPERRRLLASSASPPPARRCSARWAAPIGVADLRRHLREPARCEPGRGVPARRRWGRQLVPGQSRRDRQAAAGDPPAVHHGVRRLAESVVLRNRRDRALLAFALDVVPARGAAAPDDLRRAHRRGVPRQPVRGASRLQLAQRAGAEARAAHRPRKPPLGVRAH